MGKIYGSISNRFEEGKNYTNRDLQKDDDITMYYWSDRTCYYITNVVNQKDIFVKQYEVCADHDKAYGMGHQDWLYFKSRKDEAEYQNKWYATHPEKQYEGYAPVNLDDIQEPHEEEWVFRYNKWKEKIVYTKEKFDELVRINAVHAKNPENIESLIRFDYFRGLSDEEFNDMKNGKSIVKYFDLRGKISFGVRDYYWDWSF